MQELKTGTKVLVENTYQKQRKGGGGGGGNGKIFTKVLMSYIHLWGKESTL